MEEPMNQDWRIRGRRLHAAALKVAFTPREPLWRRVLARLFGRKS
jgi:hypothetical protein